MEIKKYNLDGTYSMHWEMRNEYNILVVKPEEDEA
jgi:hypothetical protein